MKISKDSVVAIEYTIHNEKGDIVDTSRGRRPLVYLHGHRQIVHGVESAIEGREAGCALDIHVSPEDGYGVRDPAAVMVLPRRAFPEDEDITPGSMFRAVRSDGRPIVFSVIECGEHLVVVDANHPLAGQTLRVTVEVVSVRGSTEQEREHGHVHQGDEHEELPA
jgi:FKBP-type peptidyl-prolyl cis-trans isomerase SlyD